METIYRYTLTRLPLLVAFLFCASLVQAHTATTQPQERNTLLQFVVDTHPTLASLLTKAGLTPVLSGDEAYTIFAPTEEGLKNLEKESAQRIRTVLSGHILKGKYLESDLKDGATIETLAGTKVTICRKKNYTLVDGVQIVKANQTAKNGVVHSMNGLIRL